MVQKKRLLEEFNRLISYDSESYKELDISLYLFNKLKELGLEVEIDDVGHKINDNPKATGNIYGYLKGNIKGEGIILSGHMDTVSPGINKKAIINGDLVTPAGDTVLGADDITGVVSILEALTIIKENNLPHPDIEVVFFVAEEPYCKGSGLFDFSKLKGKYAYVFDLAGKVGSAAISAPSIVSIKITINGVSAHAGFEPEKGISAIVILSNIISRLKLGRIDEKTTVNIGTMHGGLGKNIVPNKVTCEGEIRGMSDKKINDIISEIDTIIKEEVNKYGVSYELDVEENIKAYEIGHDSFTVKRFSSVLRDLGYGEPILVNTFGGSDNNSFNKHGIEGIVVANAMNDVHTTHEFFSIDEFVKSAKIALGLITKGE